MINSVRNTVLAIANKNNYGYISPQDFNLYAQQAQMDLFEEYFYSYNSWINKRNQRTAGSGYADIVKGLEEVIDFFSVEVFITLVAANIYSLPTDYYLVNKILLLTSVVDSSNGSSTSTFPSYLNDNLVDFNFQGVVIGDIVLNTDTNTEAVVTAINSNISLNLSADIFPNSPAVNSYKIFSTGKTTMTERVSQNKINYLLSSKLTAPSASFPAYTLEGNNVTVYPFGVSNSYRSQYIRYPKVPKWTWVTLTGGAPLFNSSAADYQDFELPLSDEPTLIAKICQYVGIEIREQDVYAFGGGLETKENQTES
jgi:hypothetical protein|tara:strand:+ start:104 stop:1036 length:933 start_codon:yes stop_codon:yes gene_type:complete